MIIYYKEEDIDFGWYDYSDDKEYPRNRSYDQINGDIGEWKYGDGLLLKEEEITKEEFDKLLKEWKLKFNKP